jgi:hypothetical protein
MAPNKKEEHKESWFRGLRLLWFISSVVALALLWFIDLPFFLCHPHWQLLLRELAFALLISAVFGLTIEQIQRKEFINLVNEERKNLKQDVFLYAYGFNLPEQIREEIRNSVLKSVFYRRNLVLEWEFMSPTNDELLRVKKRYTYTLVNTSDQEQTWPFRFGLIGADDVKGVQESSIDLMRLRDQRGKVTEIKPEQIAIEQSPGQHHERAFSFSFKVDPREEMEVHYEMTTRRRLYGDDNYSSKHMIVGVTKVKLRFPEKSTFEVTASCKQRKLEHAPDHDPPTVYSYEMPEGMYPHQAIAISWSLREEKTEAKEGEEEPSN